MRLSSAHWLDSAAEAPEFSDPREPLPRDPREVFSTAQAIDATSHERQRDRLREELSLAQIDRYTESIDKLDAAGRPNYRTGSATRVRPVQGSLDHKQRPQQLFLSGRNCA